MLDEDTHQLRTIFSEDRRKRRYALKLIQRGLEGETLAWEADSGLFAQSQEDKGQETPHLSEKVQGDFPEGSSTFLSYDVS